MSAPSTPDVFPPIPKPVDLSDRELEMLVGLCLHGADDLERYVNWINDRPLLPNVDTAIKRVKLEAREMRQMAVRLQRVLRQP